MNVRVVCFSLLVCAGTACSPYPRTEAEFGESVRHMVRSQQVNPDATEAQPEMSGDGQRIDNALGVYRSDVTPGRSSSSQQQPVTLQLGSTSTTAQ